MATGLTITINDVNNQGGNLARSAFNALQNIDLFKAWLDGFSAQGLVDAGLQSTLTDANVFKSAFTDLGDMSTIWKGGTPVQTIAGHDFRIFPRKLIGTGLF